MAAPAEKSRSIFGDVGIPLKIPDERKVFLYYAVRQKGVKLPD
jgi:hypothetical protein